MDGRDGHDYCSEWCNDGNDEGWGCGTYTEGDYTCDCAGCNGCSSDEVTQCENDVDGENYCTEWCGSTWGCGGGTDGDYTCSCQGCGSCAYDATCEDRRPAAATTFERC